MLVYNIMYNVLCQHEKAASYLTSSSLLSSPSCLIFGWKTIAGLSRITVNPELLLSFELDRDLNEAKKKNVFKNFFT